MYGETQSGMQCAEFDALLSDALDGALTGAVRERFEAHRASCPACGPMFAEVRTGYRMLHGLEEVEPPPMLVHNILAATTGHLETTAPARPAGESWTQKLLRWTQPVFGTVRQPRFAMSFGMAFFSVSLMLHVSGVKVADFRHVDLRPSAIAKTFYETQGKLVKYYENIRVVYEIESRVQQLKRATGSAETPTTPAPKEQKQQQKGGSNSNDKDYRNYSREKDAVTVADNFAAALALRRLS